MMFSSKIYKIVLEVGKKFLTNAKIALNPRPLLPLAVGKLQMNQCSLVQI